MKHSIEVGILVAFLATMGFFSAIKWELFSNCGGKDFGSKFMFWGHSVALKEFKKLASDEYGNIKSIKHLFILKGFYISGGLLLLLLFTLFLFLLFEN